MSTNHLITANARNKTRMIVALLKQVDLLEQELARVSASRETGLHSSPENLKLLIESVAQGKAIEAIKAVREITGLGLKEARDYVENAGLKCVKAA